MWVDFVFRPGLDDVTGYWMPVFSGDVKLGNVLIAEVGSLKVVRGYAPCIWFTDDDIASELVSSGICLRPAT